MKLNNVVIEAEYMDIRVKNASSSGEMRERLNQTMAEGIDVISVRLLPENSKNAMSLVAAADYQLCFRKDAKLADGWEAKFLEFLKSPEIRLIKKTKKGERELDLKPGIFELQIQEIPHPFMEEEKKCQAVSMLVDASSSGNIKPTMVLEAFCQDCGTCLTPYSYQVIRIDTMMRLSKEGENPRFVPLDFTSDCR